MNQISWSLFNIKSLQKQGKKFYISPSKETIYQHILAGNYFQLMFRSNNNKSKFIAVEKLWCRFVHRKNGLYFGELVSIPKIISTLKFRDKIPFCMEHILACMSQEKVRQNFSLNKNRNLAQLNKNLLSHKYIPAQWIREMPLDAKDTGWRLVAKDPYLSIDPNDFNLFELGKSDYWNKVLQGRVGARLEQTSISLV